MMWYVHGHRHDRPRLCTAVRAPDPSARCTALQKSLSLTKITHMNTGINFLICRRLLTFDNESKMLTW